MGFFDDGEVDLNNPADYGFFSILASDEFDEEDEEYDEGDDDMSKILVAYFSATGTTKRVAQQMAKRLDCDLYEIKPKVPYTDADLNWMDKNSRSTLEMKDKSSRPEIVKDGFDISGYDKILLGFPVWWYTAPTIINTFLESHNFQNKEIVIWATSGGSGLEKSKDDLEKSAKIVIKNGKIINNLSKIDEFIEII